MKIYRYLFLFLSIFSLSLSAMSDEPFDDDDACRDFEAAFNYLDRGRSGASSASAPDFVLAEPTINEEALPVPTAMPTFSEPTVYGAEDDALSSRPDRRKKGRFPCTVLNCPYPAASERERLSHERMHAKKHLTCEEPGCGYITIYRRCMKDHERIHSGARPYVCLTCHKSFATQSNCEGHKRTHLGEKSHVCSEPDCGKRFVNKSNLKRHEITHTGEKPYMCSICNSCFTQNGSLATHLCTEKHKKAVAAAAACALVLPPQQPVVQEVSEPVEPVSGKNFWLEVLHENT